jgi:urea transporter/murein DD-endopeptidase MepM/ murein hydrolase activator NlpD
MMLRQLDAILSGLPEIFFLHGKVPGAVLCAILLLNPGAALAGAVAVLAAWMFARLINMQDDFSSSSAHTYNPLLVGLSVGCAFQLTPAVVGLLAVAAILSFLLTALLSHLFQLYLKLPVLSLPFVAVNAALGLAFLRYAAALPAAQPSRLLTAYDPDLPLWAAGYFRAFGAILFSPGVLAGIVFSLLVLWRSRILFLLSVLGYYAGAAFRAQLLGSDVWSFADPAGFNFILIAMAVGGVYLVPSLKSYLLAALAVAVSTLLLDATQVLEKFTGIKASILPFNLVTLSVVYVLGVSRWPLLAWSPGRTPEETLENHLTDRLRYPGQLQTLVPPFAGKWTVWQGFNGKWTHKGDGRYGYDFVITDDAGRTFQGDGTRLENYHAYRKPVLSPVRGWVVKTVGNFPDNPPARVAENERSGNLVLIKDARGFFVKLCHFADKTLRVKEGEWVERGQVLGLCGNSGYSPQPHIHVQVQMGESGSAATIPFSFVNYAAGAEYHANDVPGEQLAIEPLYPDKNLDARLNFVLDETQTFEPRRGGRMFGRMTLKVQMAADGSFHFATPRGKLHFGRHEGTFYFYRVEGDDEWLRLMLLAMPRLPLTHRDGLTWNDYVPVGLATRGIKRALARLLSSFYPGLGRVAVSQTYSAKNIIQTKIDSTLLNVHLTGEVELDEIKGFSRIKAGDAELIRIDKTAPLETSQPTSSVLAPGAAAGTQDGTLERSSTL